ncbi:patatin-like protein 1 [Papaver somniferum]|uniref:patatin-like protein 1 n=1 Tax=Papaver somniferum TaxID=3469 RepID=UPI000E6F5839|nr:patatin-like protein 1 [Papaver somniferum]
MDGPEARVAHYFDLICGTSTGGLITAMLTAPDETNHARFTAQEINSFYFDHGATRPHGYSGSYVGHCIMHRTYTKLYIREKLGQTRMSETITPIAITDFDLKKKTSCIFSTDKAKDCVMENPLLSDVCIAAAPTYFPPHHFQVKAKVGEVEKIQEYNIIDGGIAANNPLNISYNMLTRILSRNPQLFGRGGDGEVLIISLGTGSSTRAKAQKKDTTAVSAAKWGLYHWAKETVGFTDLFRPAQDDMVRYTNDTVISLLRQLLGRDRIHYLRMQTIFTSDQASEVSSMDVASKENLRALVQVSEDLLKEQVKEENVETGCLENVVDQANIFRGDTNEQAVSRAAELLSTERRARRHT